MLARISPMICLAVVVVGIGCPRVPAPRAEPEAQGNADAPSRDNRLAHVAPFAAEAREAPRTLLEEEALPPRSGDGVDAQVTAARLMAEKRPHEAVAALRMLLSTDASAEVWQRLGEAYIATGDDVRGVRCLEEAVLREPMGAAARRALVKHYLAHDDAKARAHAEELVRMQPTDAASRQLLGRAQMQQKMWKEAIASLVSVVDAEPENIFAHNNIGYSALQIGELALAREHLERCLVLEPQQGYMLNNLGVTYERLGMGAEAHAAFTRAAELSPRYARANLNRDRLQVGLTQEERIASAEVLLRMRAPKPMEPASGEPAADSAPVDPVQAAVELYTGGSARLAPALTDEAGR